MKQLSSTSIWCIVGAITLILAYTLFSAAPDHTQAEQSTLIAPDSVDHIHQYGYTLGKADAPVLIQNYSNFSCLHCKMFASTTEQKLIAQYVVPGIAKIVFHPVSYDSLSMQAAIAGYCAKEQNHFWAFHDLLFANYLGQASDLSQQRLIQYASYIHLDVATFINCIHSTAASSAITADNAHATKLGIMSTPTFLINGIKILGNQPLHVFQAAIEAAKKP